MEKEKIILWGTGIRAKEIVSNYALIEDMFDIIGVVDSDNTKWGMRFEKHIIISPEDIFKLEFDKIVISSARYFDEIKGEIVQSIGISKNKVENNLYFARKKLLRRYSESHDSEIQEVIHYMEKTELKVFNYPFAKDYESMGVKTVFDDNAGMYYVMHNGKRLYMAKYLNTVEKVERYYCSICMEQDVKSPHCYLDSNYQVNKGDKVLDVGVAEGNFSLDIIDKASKVYMVESDRRWIEALEYTFDGYKDKVLIINAFASDISDEDNYRLDDLIDEPLDFIKMDIEGYENAALNGASNIINISPNIKCAICTYHNDNDETDIKKTVGNYGMSYETTRGYMYFPYEVMQRYQPTLRRGVLRCWKGNK